MENKKIQVFSNEQFKVHGYIDENGIARLNAEDTARNLGIVETKKHRVATSGDKFTASGDKFTTSGDNYTSVRWNRVNQYIKEIKANVSAHISEEFASDFPDSVGKGDYISEHLVYLLAMKASNEMAIKFQLWLVFEVLTKLFQTGSYTMPNAAPNEAISPDKKIDALIRCAEMTNLDRLRNQILRKVTFMTTGERL